MNAYKKDFEKAIEMIDWQNEMLKKQAERIGELEKNAKPVAWMEYIQDEEWEVWYVEPTNLPKGHTYKPLYTTPQIKELSDEEIDEVLYSMDWAHDPVKFARAILKKASEK